MHRGVKIGTPEWRGSGAGGDAQEGQEGWGQGPLIGGPQCYLSI